MKKKHLGLGLFTSQLLCYSVSKSEMWLYYYGNDYDIMYDNVQALSSQY